MNTMRAVRLYESNGASAIQLEDQLFPKRCGHLAGKKVIETEEMEGKIKAAIEARRVCFSSPPFLRFQRFCFFSSLGKFDPFVVR